MAAPPEITLKDVSGKWVMNKTLSDSTDSILKMQGIPWLIRRMVSFATVTLVMKQYNTNEHNGNEVTHIDITQIATGGVVTTESRILDWTLRDHKDHVFGDVKLKSRWVNLINAKEDRNDDDENVDVDEFLKRGWDDDLEGEHVQTWGESEKKGWIANQIWGFEIINGQRHYASHLELRKGNERLLARLVYDYQT